MQTTIKILNATFGLAIVIILCLIGLRMYNPEILSGYEDWNAPTAYLATILLLVVLLPGVLTRFGISAAKLKYLIVYRRTLGILMYLAALIHFLFLIDYLPWFSDGLIKSFDALTASGIASVIILLPVLLTSNNLSVRLLGRWWKVVQRITYIILLFVVIHLWQSGQIVLAVIYGIFIALIISSYFMQSIRKGASPMRMLAILAITILVTAGLTYLTLLLLFKRPQDAAMQKELDQYKSRTTELESAMEGAMQEISDTKSELLKQQIRVKEFEKIEQDKKDVQEAAAQAEAERIAEQERIAAEAKAEAERIAALTTYRNGTYTGIGSYSTDKGKKTERIDVKLSISGDVVRGVEIISYAKANKSVKYVGRFNKDIAGIVVGRRVDSLDVHGIGGASDTSTGFRTALASIKAKARQR